ncbi:hypothetical protein H7A76_32090 [Pseudomonas sp. MSSRFD41]|uniref:hypothetical protein n=1 Tax=Pseudomonas sp. MSSRFD41 TaxID=1310370 RepID=UPI001639E973|nr:hypothetical protein [Pseudomonas sp. MSSRFD41]MBC2660093.1 hypothetical protein [Pseudomonas sp. MSSRFD41]
MTIDKEKLKALAERAIANNHPGGGGNPFPALAVRAADVLTLLAEIERLEVDNGSMRGSTKRMGEDASRAQKQARKSQREIDHLKAEIEHLTESRDEARELRDKIGDRYDEAMAELAGLRTGFDAQNEIIAQLKAEREALRSTCARAQACMDRWAGGHAFDADGPGGRIRDELYDAYRPDAREGIAKLHEFIDAAMSKGEQS